PFRYDDPFLAFDDGLIRSSAQFVDSGSSGEVVITGSSNAAAGAGAGAGARAKSLVIDSKTANDEKIAPALADAPASADSFEIGMCDCRSSNDYSRSIRAQWQKRRSAINANLSLGPIQTNGNGETLTATEGPLPALPVQRLAAAAERSLRRCIHCLRSVI